MNAVSVLSNNATATHLLPTKRSNYGAVAEDLEAQVPDVEEIELGLRSFASGTEEVSPHDEIEDGGDSSCVSMSGSTGIMRPVSHRDKTNANTYDISSHSVTSKGTSSSYSYLSAGDTSGSGGKSSDSGNSTDRSRHSYPPSRDVSSSSLSGYEVVSDSVLQGVYATLGMALPFTSAFSGSPHYQGRMEHESEAIDGSESCDGGGLLTSQSASRANSETLLGVTDAHSSHSHTNNAGDPMK